MANMEVWDDIPGRQTILIRPIFQRQAGSRRPLSLSDQEDADKEYDLMERLDHLRIEDSKPRIRCCGLCNVKLSSSVQASQHYAGKAHNKKLNKLRLP